jgi:hypothetical protein
MVARRSPGVVRDAIVKVMKGQGAMTTQEVLEAVRKHTGEDIPSSSVRSYLRITPTMFDRVDHGTYKLRSR